MTHKTLILTIRTYEFHHTDNIQSFISTSHTKKKEVTFLDTLLPAASSLQMNTTASDWL